MDSELLPIEDSAFSLVEPPYFLFNSDILLFFNLFFKYINS